MSFYDSRTDGELVELAQRGDRSARAALVDRTLLPASRVAAPLVSTPREGVDVLVAAYRETFDRVTSLDDSERFLPVLLSALPRHAPFAAAASAPVVLQPKHLVQVRQSLVGPRFSGQRLVMPMALVALLVALTAAVATTWLEPPDPTTAAGQNAAQTGEPEDSTAPTDATQTPTTAPDDSATTEDGATAPGDGPATPDPDGADDDAGDDSSEDDGDNGEGPDQLAETL